MIKIFLKLLNPLIWIHNWLSYFGHLDLQNENQKCGDDYEPYDFDNDIKYF